MGLTRNGSYKVYFNSSKESRGVGIAIKRNIKHEIVNRFVGNADENVLLLDIILKGVRLTLGVIYGPNNTDREFFHSIERQIVAWGNKCIIGGILIRSYVKIMGGVTWIGKVMRGCRTFKTPKL